jgi:hypothetical protein
LGIAINRPAQNKRLWQMAKIMDYPFVVAAAGESGGLFSI